MVCIVVYYLFTGSLYSNTEFEAEPLESPVLPSSDPVTKIEILCKTEIDIQTEKSKNVEKSKPKSKIRTVPSILKRKRKLAAPKPDVHPNVTPTRNIRNWSNQSIYC